MGAMCCRCCECGRGSCGVGASNGVWWARILRKIEDIVAGVCFWREGERGVDGSPLQRWLSWCSYFYMNLCVVVKMVSGGVFCFFK